MQLEYTKTDTLSTATLLCNDFLKHAHVFGIVRVM